MKKEDIEKMDTGELDVSAGNAAEGTDNDTADIDKDSDTEGSEETDISEDTPDDDEKESKPESAVNKTVAANDKTLASNKKKIIIELALAVIAIAAIVIAIVIKKRNDDKPVEEPVVTETPGMINIDNSALFENPPAVSPMVQNEDLDYEALVSEGKMLKLKGNNGQDIYVHNYTNSSYFNEETKYDEAELNDMITKTVLVNFLEKTETDRDTAQMYDTVSINYAGTMDGVAFDGGTANDQEVTIGVSAYIDGFTEGIVGMKVGETKDVHVTFPEDYSNTDLAGKPAVFAITLNKIIAANKVPELTDEIASSYTGGELTTAAALKEHFKKNLLSTSIWKFIDTDFYISDLPEDTVIAYYNKLLETLDKSSKQYQMSAESLIGMYYGTDVEEYKKQMMTEAVESMRHAVLYNAIAAKENVTVSDDDILKLATDYGYADKVDDFKQEYGEDIIHDYILQSNLMDFFITLHD